MTAATAEGQALLRSVAGMTSMSHPHRPAPACSAATGGIDNTARPDSPTPPRSAPTSPDGERRTDLPPRLPAWARILLTAFLIIPAASATLLGLGVLSLFGKQDLFWQTDEIAMVVRIACWTLPLIAYLLFSWALVRWVDRRPFRALGLTWNRNAAKALGIGTMLAVVIAVAGYGVAAVAGLGAPMEAAGAAGVEAGPMGPLLIVLTLIMLLVRAYVLQGIGEELLFRGYLMQSLARRPHAAVWLSAFAFCIPHLTSTGGQQNLLDHLVYLLIPFGFGVSAGYLAIAMRSVWAAIGIHGGFHVGNAVAGVILLELPWGIPVHLVLGLAHLALGLVIAVRIPASRWAEVAEQGPYGR